ncbi:MAG TPA: hypothetical protein VHO72_07355 [Bacteroidales bacterium]|nr:hypothetical protein [Bacteroidales bacterium]
MIKRVSNILGIAIIPRWLLVHLLILAIAFGGFTAVMFISVISFFIVGKALPNYPEAIAISGFLGVLVYQYYKYLNQSFRYRVVIRFFFLFVAFCLALAFLLPKVSENYSAIFILFVAWLPVTITGEQVIIGIAEQIIVPRLQQNLKRFIEAGIITGAILFSIGIAVLSHFGISPMVYIPSFALILIIVIESEILIKRLELKSQEKEEQVESVISLFSGMPQKLKMLSLVLFTLLSVINFVFIDYSFLTVLSTAFTDYKDLVMFLAIFFAATMGVNLAFKLFVYQNLIKTFRINKALFLPSVFLLGVLVVLGALYFIPHHLNFLLPARLIFLTILLGRFFAYILRESFEVNVFRLILSAFSTYSQKIISPNVGNLLRFWGYLLAGLVFLLIASLGFRYTHTHLLSNMAFVICWIVVSAILIFNYSGLIKLNIEKLSAIAITKVEDKAKQLKERLVISSNLAGMKYLLNYQRHYQPFDFQKSLQEIPDSVRNKLGLANEVGVSATNEHTSTEISFYDSDENLKITDIELLASSIRIKDRIRAAHKIAESGEPKYSPLFKMLIRDNDDEVKRAAFLSVVKYYNSEIIGELIEYINHEEFSNIVSDVLAKIGDNALSALQEGFYKPEVDFRTQLQIIKIVGKMNSFKARDFLIDKLIYPNKWIAYEASDVLLGQSTVEALYHNATINKAIHSVTGVAAWIIALDLSIENVSDKHPVKTALFEEYSLTVQLLFNLLQLKYNSHVFSFLKNRFIYSTSNEQNEFNVELLQKVIVDEDVKERLFPLLHNNQKSVKIEQLKKFFPLQMKSKIDALCDIIVADSSHVSTWLKACALKLYIDLNEDPAEMEISAQVFNPNPLISEIAFFGIYQKFPGKIEALMDRIPPRLKNRVLEVLKFGNFYEYKLLFNKVNALQRISYFNKISGHHLIPLAEMLEEFKLYKSESRFIKCSEEEVLPALFVPQGEVTLLDMHRRNSKLGNNNLYGLGLYAGGITLSAYSESVIYFARPENIGHLVINYNELSAAFYKYIQNSNFY